MLPSNHTFNLQVFFDLLDTLVSNTEVLVLSSLWFVYSRLKLVFLLVSTFAAQLPSGHVLWLVGHFLLTCTSLIQVCNLSFGSYIL